jgi:hypothetical protein
MLILLPIQLLLFGLEVHVWVSSHWRLLRRGTVVSVIVHVRIFFHVGRLFAFVRLASVVIWRLLLLLNMMGLLVKG